MGLVSPGGVHSHQDHAAALANMLAAAGVPRVVHAFTDGRDTPPRSARATISRSSAPALPAAVSRSRTVCGRYYAMDRDNRWDRVEKAYDAMVDADGPRVRRRAGAAAESLCARHHRRVRAAGGDRRLSRHARRRRRAVLQLPRRPRARDPGRPARSGVRRLPAQRTRASSPPPPA